MKKLFLSLLLCFSGAAFSQNDQGIREILEFQEDLNTSFLDAEATPLTPEDLQSFKGLEFFPVDTNFRVEGQFVRTPMETPFEMPTTTDRKPLYVKYGEIYFNLQGREQRLDVFQNLELSSKPEYKDYLFVPFTDNTNGYSTYDGGRYLDLRIPEGNTMILDFNQAYNPYCAYNGKYSCPIPPEQNHLDVAITAGVKNFK